MDIAPRRSAMTDSLPLEASVVRERDGYTISLPVRSEAVHVSKQVVVGERVVVRREMTTETERIDTRVRRERLRLDLHGDLEATQPLDRTEPLDRQ